MKTHGPLNIDVFIEPMFQENCYLLWSHDGPEAWIVDPGFPPQPDQLLATARKRELKPAAALITHAHVDHIAGLDALRAAEPELSIIAPRDEHHMFPEPQANLSAQIGLTLTAPEPNQLAAPGDTLTLGPLTWRVLDVTGHSPGGVAYYCPDAGVVFTGDALFAGSVGRTDFPGGSAQRLLDNIRDHLLTLPDETAVYSGHGPPTTIARERDTNPFLQGGSSSWFDG